MESTNHYPVDNNLMAIINKLQNDDDAESHPPLTNNNHCNHLLDQQTTPLPFSTNHSTGGNTHPIVHHPNRDTDAPLSSNSIWDLLMAQIQTQLRSMSPDACFVHVRELQEMAHSELLLSRIDDHLNGMSPLPLVGHQHTQPTTGYRNDHQSTHTTLVSSISSPMRQQQPAVGSRSAQLALFSPMARGLTTSPQSRAPPYHHAAAYADETELEVSSSPSKMVRMTAINDEGLEDSPSHTNEDPVMSSNVLKFREDSPPVLHHPRRPRQPRRRVSPPSP